VDNPWPCDLQRHVLDTLTRGVAGMIGSYELEFIEDRTPYAQAPSPTPNDFAQLVDAHEQAFIDGLYQHPQAEEDWCLTHMPC